VAHRHVLFGTGLGAWNGADVSGAGTSARLASQADRDGLDLFTVADHPYFGAKLDAYALVSFLLGRTERISGAVTVTNLPSHPAPVLARTRSLRCPRCPGGGSCSGSGREVCGT
jgi:alkanesulfonate monooxygenase SsuD/methylene tetrahydromethanopterin reductase-like flavin-dependent oxidoreductase (luciferase family)